ncbi:MAG TPA: DEAD/DEAH box helicase [bacterium]|nr:DEAD/DEAH box helicase [bacterium]
MTLDQIIEALHTRPRFAPQFTAWHTIPERPAEFAPFPPGLDARLLASLGRTGIRELYSHQAEAYRLVRGGADVVVVTPTASGKTLCYNLPVLDTVLREPEARALYLFPTKALGADQVDELQTVTGALGADVRAFTYDGDTPADARRTIRTAGHVVVTNPDMLHTAILPHHTKWLRLFENLRYVVLDELHHYRGVFGSHLANVLRRLARICRFYGSAPQFICCSATIGNPREHAERLTGRPMAVIDRNGAPSGERVIGLYNPPVVNEHLGIRADAVRESVALAGELLGGRIQTIFFARSRLAAELLTTYLRAAAERRALPPDAICGYRAGYLPSERRRIEAGLRSGTVRAVAATNALELGIDIGQLSAAVLVGYPGTIASTWQQMGRAGRRRERALAVLVATSAALDQFIVRHPDYVLRQGAEEARTNPDNLLVLASHLKCAAFELPLRDGETFGPSTLPEILTYLEEARVLHHEEDAWHYVAEAYPAQEVSLRSASQENVVIIDTTDPRPRVIGEIDLASAPAFVHEDAIYLHLGQQYHVDRLDWDERKAYVRRVEVDYYTDAQIATDLRVLAEFARVEDAAHGEVTVTFRPTIFKKLTLSTHENVGFGTIHLPETTLHTTAAWWVFPRARAADLDPVFRGANGNDALQGALLGAAHALHNLAPLYLMCDPRDLGALAEIRSPHTGEPTVTVYEQVPGGVGQAERLYALRHELLQAAAALVEGCACEAGCPSCVGPVLAIGPDAKRRTLRLLRHVCVPA